MLKIRNKATGKVMNCTQGSWIAICERYGAENKFEVVDGDVNIEPKAVKLNVEEVKVPPMAELPEVQESKATRKRKKKPENE